MGESGSGVRASTAERQQAVDALHEHREQQRLDSTEFDARVAKANEARSRGELLALFDDLPEPRPWFDTAIVPAEPALTEEPALPVDRDGAAVSRPVGMVGKAAYALFPLGGVVALVLFFSTGARLWFLLIPLAFYLARRLSKVK